MFEPEAASTRRDPEDAGATAAAGVEAAEPPAKPVKAKKKKSEEA